jgi:NAD(P)-dependent dehydrogenase (short-subunit alcohol dehydrogenase family)
MNMSFENKVALVTGAAAGMGLATAKALAQAGAAVVLADFKEEVVRAEAQKLTAAGYKAMAIRCDVIDDAQVAAMVGPHSCRIWPTRRGVQQCRGYGPHRADRR